MRFLKSLSAVAIALLIAPQIAAAANPAEKLSLDAEGAGGGSGGKSVSTYLLVGAGLAAVIAGAVLLGDNNDSTPASA